MSIPDNFWGKQTKQKSEADEKANQTTSPWATWIHFMRMEKIYEQKHKNVYVVKSMKCVCIEDEKQHQYLIKKVTD